MLLSILCLALTLITCLTGPVSTQNQDDVKSPNNFCSGVPGVPGLPGVPGNPGVQGVAGLPAVAGSPGVTGPSGVAGLPGSDGTSIKGDKGDTGDKGDPGRTRRSAFTAIRTSPQTGDFGDTLIFNEVLTNINGHFNPATNIFTCVFPGTYSFTYSIAAYNNMSVWIELARNGHRIVTTFLVTAANVFDFASNSVIVNLEAGERVWLRFLENGKTVYSDSSRYTNFSGILLYEN